MRARIHQAMATVILLAVPAARVGMAAGAGEAVITPRADVRWKAGTIPGVSTAAVDGDMAKGASHFYLKYAAGFSAPLHHHSPDHYVTTVSGNLVLVVDGQEHRLAPGSYFALSDRKPHAARCEGSEDCVMFVDARGPWDVVPERAAAARD